MAAAAPPRAPIEDDWQDLDSNLSVRSLSASDDEDGDDGSIVDLGRGSSNNSEPTGGHSPTNRDQSDHLSASSSSLGAAFESGHHFDLPLRPASARSSAPSTLYERKPPAYSNDDVSPIDDKEKGDLGRCYSPSNASEGTIRDPAHNPVNHHKSLQHLIDVVKRFQEDLMKNLELPLNSDPAVLTKLYGILCSLRDQFDDLEPILASYSKHWSKEGQSLIADEIPLHTGLLEWMENTEPILLDLERTTRKLADMEKTGTFTQATEVTIVGALNDDITHLGGFEQSLKEFLPLMKIDHSKFQTKHMNFPDCEPTAPDNHPCHPAPRPEMARIRRELYSLKDEIQHVYLVLDGIFKHVRTAERPEDADKVMESLQILSKVITTSLTNNGSEWIDSTISETTTGGAGPSRRQRMSYPAFASLSPDVLQDVTGHLGRFRVEIDVASEPWMHAGFSRRMVRNHQLVLLTECGQLSTLKATLDFLESMLLGESTI